MSPALKQLYNLSPQPIPNYMHQGDWQIPSYEVKEFFQRRSKFCICIPIINEGERIKKQLLNMALQAKELDIILCDGGSTDGSLADDLLRRSGIRTVLTKTGPGKLSAQLRMGYSYALLQGYEGIITIDGNGKDGIDAIPAMAKELEHGLDFVQGSRFVPGGVAVNTPFIRWAAIRLIHAPLLSLGAHHLFTDTTNGFRAYSKNFLLDPRVQPFRNIFSTYELLAYLTVRAPRLGFKVKEIPVTRQYPKTGKIPTKIHHWSGLVDLLSIIWKAITGQYNPTTQNSQTV